MTEFTDILYSVDGPVATITLNRPDNLNALTFRMHGEIRDALALSENDPNVVGSVLTGAGRGFCAGVDMGALSAAANGQTGAASDHFGEAPGNPERDPNFIGNPIYFLGLRKPLIAAVNGACAGMGFSYATFCDMRFMEKGARLVSAFSHRGLVAEHGTSWLLPRLVGPSNALDIFWSSRRIEAEEAHRMGWANRLCEPGCALVEAQHYVRTLAKGSAPISLMMMKRQVWRHLNAELGEAFAESGQMMVESLTRSDFKEGVQSFVDKRPPEFRRVTAD